jgi:5,5'-dehydrodivanillate O-demethylase
MCDDRPILPVGMAGLGVASRNALAALAARPRLCANHHRRRCALEIAGGSIATAQRAAPQEEERMLTKEANERLTQVGPGTPMGNLLRRYWYPVATTTELAQEPVLPVRLLGEDLALFQTEQGALGLVTQRCPHRGASLAYGIPEEDGLRCCYHGWKFNAQGACLEQPAEPPESTFCQRVRIPAYPAQEMGGLVWAYLGPEPVPLLPRYDLFVLDHLEREIGSTYLPCNWLQIMENTMDPVHLEFLHTKFFNFRLRKQGKAPIMQERHHLKIAFDVFELGIMKRRLLEGDPEDADDWRVGHPLIFPNILALGGAGGPRFEIRVPVDDTHTLVYHYFTKPVAAGTPPQTEIPVYEVPYKDERGRFIVDTVLGQDMLAWVTQGEVADRTAERLGTSDRGVILLRNLLNEQLEKVARGEDPMAVVRDPARNEVIRVPREDDAFFTHTGGMIGEKQEDPLAMIRVRKDRAPVG